MKRFISLLMVLMMCFSLFACGGSDNQEESSKGSNEEVKGSEVKESEDQEPDFAKQVLFDNDQCKLTITAIEGNAKKGMDFKLLLENKTEDRNLTFSNRAASVDGVNYNPFFAETVAASKKSNKVLDISSRDYKKQGANLKFSDIMLNFYVYDSDDFMAKPVVDEEFHVYPFGEGEAVKYIREEVTTDQVLFDTDEVKIVVTGYNPDDLFGFAVNFYLENKTDHEIMVASDDSSVNGFMVDNLFANTVPANTVSFEEMTWFSNSLEENGIEEIEEIEFNLKAYNAEDWLEDHYIDDVVVLRP